MFDGWEVIQVSSRLAVRSNLRRSHNLGLLVPVDLSVPTAWLWSWPGKP